MPAVNDQPCPVGPSETFKTSRLSPKSTNATDLAVFAHAPRHFCAPFGRATSKPPRQTTPRSVPTIPIAESPEQAVQSNPVYKRSLPNHPRQLASCHATSYKPPDSGFAEPIIGRAFARPVGARNDDGWSRALTRRRRHELTRMATAPATPPKSPLPSARCSPRCCLRI
jgi:hypothetical protein